MSLSNVRTNTAAAYAYLSGSMHEVIKRVALVGANPRRPIMVIDAGQIFVARNGEVACYTPAGDPVWVQPFSGMGMGSVALGLPGVLRQADDSGSR